MQKNIAIKALTTISLKRAQELAAELNLEIVETESSYPFLLVVTPEHLELQKTNSNAKPVKIDFLQGSLDYRLSKKGSIELLAKAIRFKTKEKLFVIDATAGLGRDGFLLATLGCKVLLLERSPLISALLQDGLQRALADKRYKNLDIQLLQVDANIFLQNLTKENYPDIIYLDPMYPERTKSALVKKEMRYLQELIGKDEDAEELLGNALQRAKKRVIVKRPISAPEIKGTKPNYSLKGKNTRLDIYSIIY